MGDYQTELTLLYTKLTDIQSTLIKLASASSVNTVQVEMQRQMNSLASRLAIITSDIQTLQMAINDIITNLKGV